MTACHALHEHRQQLIRRALSDWPAERVDLFTTLFEQFNSSVEALLRTDAAATSREMA